MIKKVVLLLILAGFMVPGAADARSATNGVIHRQRIKGLDIVAILDSPVQGHKEWPLNLSREEFAKMLEPEGKRGSVNVFLARVGDKTVLFDAGMEKRLSSSVFPGLSKAGVSPDAIDVVAISHFHWDHTGGLLLDGKAAFPNARLFVPAKDMKAMPGMAEKLRAAYGNRITEITRDGEIIPGVRAEAAHGHSPGHTIYRIQNNDGVLLFVGDLVNFPFQLDDPNKSVVYDQDQDAARVIRKGVLERAARDRMPIAASHIEFPGLGTLAKKGKGYVFTPLKQR